MSKVLKNLTFFYQGILTTRKILNVKRVSNEQIPDNKVCPPFSFVCNFAAAGRLQRFYRYRRMHSSPESFTEIDLICTWFLGLSDSYDPLTFYEDGTCQQEIHIESMGVRLHERAAVLVRGILRGHPLHPFRGDAPL